MIYKDSFWKKELKQAYIQRKITLHKQFELGLFAGLITFAIHFMLKTFDKSVINDTFPELMQSSYFSTISLYLIVISIALTVNIIINFDYLTFAEIKSNKWYILVKNNYNPLKMIGTKLFARTRDIFLVYTIGFVTTLLLTAFLKYPIVFTYLPSLYISGLVNVELLVVMTMVASLFTYKNTKKQYIVIGVLLSLLILSNVTGYYKVISNRAMMTKLSSIIDLSLSIYPLIVIGIMILSFVIIVCRAKTIAMYSKFDFYVGDMDFSRDYNIVNIENDNYLDIKKNRTISNNRERILNICFNIFFALIIIIFLIFNAIILAISVASPEKEIDIFGYTPYVFQSETMEDSIMYNDLVFFKTVEEDYVPKEGQILLFDNSGEVSVARAQEVEADAITVDIDKYPIAETKGQMHKTIGVNSVYGIYAGRSRWLGAVIVMANTTIGRVLMLIIPVVLLFYHKTIINTIKKILETSKKE